MHEKCSKLTLTEIRAITLKTTRNVVFFCHECIANFKKMPQLLRNLSEVLEANKRLQEENANLQERLENLSASIARQDVLSNGEEIMSELLERQNRANNIILYNVNEVQAVTKAQYLIQEKRAIHNVLEDFNIEKEDIKFFRLGKAATNRCRPIKVILRSQADAKLVLKNKNLIKIPSIKVASDQTVLQRKYFQRIKSELQGIVDDGDDSKTIKFVNNKPTIVNKTRRIDPKNRSPVLVSH